MVLRPPLVVWPPLVVYACLLVVAPVALWFGWIKVLELEVMHVLLVVLPGSSLFVCTCLALRFEMLVPESLTVALFEFPLVVVMGCRRCS